jgi:hypothetical protein
VVSVNVRVRHNLDEGAERIGELPERLVGAMRDGARRAGDEIEDAQKRTINRRTGRTAGTIGQSYQDTPNGAEVSVGTSDRIAGYLQHGTRPHRIEARNAKALRFEMGGGIVFAKSVMHPGTAPTEWLERAGQLSLNPVERAFEDEVGEVLR